MTEQMKITVMGASGRMGRALMEAVAADETMTLIGGTERAGHDWIGQDAGVALGSKPMDAPIVEDPLPLFAKADAVIDFTRPEASVFHAELAAQARCVLVLGTTGFSPADLKKITAAARHARIIRAGNMSLGVNLLVELTRQVARALDDSYDIEISETHHRHKVDAPSGTALMLGEAAAAGRGVMLDKVAERGRSGITGARGAGAIGFSSLRAGDVVGEHDVIFAAGGERLVLRHIATDRSIFVRGALRAARWGLAQPAGEYNMASVLGLNGEL